MRSIRHLTDVRAAIVECPGKASVQEIKYKRKQTGRYFLFRGRCLPVFL